MAEEENLEVEVEEGESVEVLLEEPESEKKSEVKISESELDVQVEAAPEQSSKEDEISKEEKITEKELEEHGQKVQTRINKITAKYRKEERDREEAVRISKQLLDENNKLKSRVKQLDSGYLQEYGVRLQSQSDSAKRLYKEAHELGDADQMIVAQEQLAKIAVEQQRYDSAKMRVDQAAQQPVAQQQVAQQQVAQQPAVPKVDPKAEEWAKTNTWFGDDKIMTNAVLTIHQDLISEEGFDANTDEYYNELNRRMRTEFPHKFETKKRSGGGSQVASAGSSASRNNKPGRRSVKLSHSEVSIAKKLGVPLEEYAKYVKR